MKPFEQLPLVLHAILDLQISGANVTADEIARHLNAGIGQRTVRRRLAVLTNFYHFLTRSWVGAMPAPVWSFNPNLVAQCKWASRHRIAWRFDISEAARDAGIFITSDDPINATKIRLRWSGCAVDE